MTVLAEYTLLPIAFPVNQVLDVTARAEGGFALSARMLEVPYVKDYDAVDGEGPLHWSRRFDVSNWTLFTARVAGSRVGGATVAFDTPGLTMLEGRRDLSVLWDIRVAPNARGKGIGSALFEKVEGWARAHSCRQLKVETQNINVPACGFLRDTGASSERSTMPRILNCRRKSNCSGTKTCESRGRQQRGDSCDSLRSRKHTGRLLHVDRVAVYRAAISRFRILLASSRC